MKRFLIGLVAPLLFGACATQPDYTSPKKHVEPLRGSPIVDVSTDYTQSLYCIADYARQQNFPAPRVAVGHITDLTGADDALTGRRLTQGGTLMAISAVTKAGMRVVERFDMGVIQVELEYAQNGLLRDAPGILRKTTAGQVEGADLYIVGGITEYNPNIRSQGAQAYGGTNDDPGGAISVGFNEYIIDVGLDLRIIDTRSTEVIGVKALRKQIRGQEVEAGVFSFFGGSVIDIGGGQRALEPVQTAVRSMIERSVYEFMRDLYGLDASACAPNTALGAPESALYETKAPKAQAEDVVLPPQVFEQPQPRTVQAVAAPQPVQPQPQPVVQAAPVPQQVTVQPQPVQPQAFVVEVGSFSTYSSAVATMGTIKQRTGAMISHAPRIFERRGPSGRNEYALRYSGFSDQQTAGAVCQQMMAIGHRCEVGLQPVGAQASMATHSNTLQW